MINNLIPKIEHITFKRRFLKKLSTGVDES